MSDVTSWSELVHINCETPAVAETRDGSWRSIRAEITAINDVSERKTRHKANFNSLRHLGTAVIFTFSSPRPRLGATIKNDAAALFSLSNEAASKSCVDSLLR